MKKKWVVSRIGDISFGWIGTPREVCQQIYDIFDSIQGMLECCMSNPDLFKIEDMRK